MTAHQLLKITIDQLKPGMYVNNVFNNRGILLYSANTLIQSHAQVDALKRQGVTTLNINLQKGSGCEIVLQKQSENTTEPIDRKIAVKKDELFSGEDIKKAEEIRSYTVESLKSIMSSAKSGRIFSINSLVTSVESIVDSMLNEPELLLNLCRLKAHATDAYTHSVNVSVLNIGFASALGLPHEKIMAAGIGGLLHDIGLVSLPEELFMKQGTCTRQEHEMFKKHPALGLQIIANNKKVLPDGISQIIGQHHERVNGCGYPNQLSGNKIDDLAIICAITDMYDTLTTHGMFNKVYLPQEALALIFQGSDEEFPRSFVEYFTKLLGIYPVGSFVKLDTGEMGVVIKNNRRKLLSPTVRILFNSQGNRLVTPYIKDLSISDDRSDDMLARILNSLDPSLFKIDIDNFILQQQSN